MSSITELDKLSNIAYYDLMKPVYQQSFPTTWKQNLALVCAQRELDRIRVKRDVNKKVRELSELDEVRTCLLTISLDQKVEKRDCTKKATKIVDFILGRNLSYLNQPIISIEFFTPQWNPHIHIYTELALGQKPGALAQRIRRLIEKKYPLVYNVNATQGNAKNQLEYLTHLKQKGKQSCQQQDNEHRENYNIPQYYNASNQH